MLCRENSLTRILHRFYSGRAYFVFCVLLSSLGVILNTELISAALLIVLLTGQFIVLRDTSRMFYPILFMIMTLVNVTGADMMRGAWLGIGAVPVLSAIAYNIIKGKKKFRPNAIFLPMLAVSVAVCTGGLFSISAEHYFDIGNVYYIVFLGFGMTGLCAVVYTMWDGEELESLKNEFIRAIVHSGIFVSFVMMLYYLLNLSEFTKTLQVVEVLAHNPFRNVAVSHYMLSMPFLFYCARKKPVYLLWAVFMYGACLISGSRMGLLLGSAEFLLLIVYYIVTLKKRRWLYGAVFIAVLAVVFIMRDDILYFYFGRDEFGEGFFRMEEARVTMMRRTIPDFLSNPVFGKGLGYRGNEDCYLPGFFEMNWHHNLICQIVGGLGIVGIAAYCYQYYYRLNLLLKRTSSFKWLICLMYVGVLMNSLVDPGIFIPFPTTFLLNCAFMMAALEDKRLTEAHRDVV